MPDRRTQLLDAALAVVAEKGMKGLTHRAVDAAAALPQGTTSNYYRNRAALVEAVLDRLLQLDAELLQDTGPAGPPQDIDQLAGQLAALVLALARQHAGLTRARLALSLDHPEAVTAGHHLLVDGLSRALTALGVADAEARARDVADYGDGLLLHLLTVRSADNPDPKVIAGAIRRLLGP
ncbi:DNA-binding transcriptional regulator YbjK [Arthrobacter ulcerisalmonis]|uniref:TetR/AcrR family transcriptional regulator n=1 Tax=Arthrobacter sp. B1I2 TaxID=3042263 RepID=UPI0027839D6B|nr:MULTISPECIES: TetR family transcriptional regulator [Arthrobacter]MDQ0662376.1 DNA-binding transcriptional regulator YbjK [Arthrobacter ulcerisalmonis]MDQ0730309.1 DNA-binding transcriptional regulator YbjK [Arthrobacter sp. B1I2]